MIVVPADSAQRTRYGVLSAGECWFCKNLKAFAVELVNVSLREKLELLQVAELALLRSFLGINTRDLRR